MPVSDQLRSGTHKKCSTMETKEIPVEALEMASEKKAENYYMEIELEDKGQDFLKLQLDKEGNVVGASPFFSQFCKGLKIKIDSILLNWYPDFDRRGSGSLKYKVINYHFLLSKTDDFKYKKRSAFEGCFERFEDIGICEDSKQHLKIEETERVQDFCVEEANAWFQGFEDDSKENRLLFAILLFNKLQEKYKKK